MSKNYCISFQILTSTFACFCSQFLEAGWYDQLGGEGTLADAIMDRISYDSYKINIVGIDPSKDISMREVYGLDPAEAQ